MEARLSVLASLEAVSHLAAKDRLVAKVLVLSRGPAEACAKAGSHHHQLAVVAAAALPAAALPAAA